MSRLSITGMFGVTRYCRTSPPIGITCETPGIVSSLGRTTQSASSRSRIGDSVSLDTAISMISPMIEEIGAICGEMFSGSCSRTSARRSVTCCRFK